MAAAVVVQLRLHGLPCGRPHRTAVHIFEVEVSSRAVVGDPIEVIARDAEVSRISIEHKPTGGIGDNPTKTSVAQVIEPRRGRVRPGYNIFPVVVVVISEIH